MSGRQQRCTASDWEPIGGWSVDSLTLDVDPDQGPLPAEGERGDPLIVLAKRLV